jgi:hypothetical protein
MVSSRPPRRPADSCGTRRAEEPARHRAAAYDPFGAVTVTGGLALLVYAISTAPQAGWDTARTVTLLAVSAALLAAFLVVETRVEAPLMPLRIFRLKTLAGANAVGLLLGGSFFAFIFIGTLYMQQVLGYSALKAGLAWLAATLTSVAFAGLAQALVTRGSAKLVMAAGGPDRRRRALGDPGAGTRAFLGRLGRSVPDHRRRHRVRLHPGVHRGPGRCGRT